MTKIMPVKAAHNWKNNGYLVADIARLHFNRRMLTLDPTYGKGVWWQRWRPTTLFDHDLELDGHDFRDLPYESGMFDLIAFDPPYVSKGGRETTTIKEFYERYGLTGAPTSPLLLQLLIEDGLTEMERLCKPGGLTIVKSMPYISSGKHFPGDFLVQRHARRLGFVEIDKFIHLGSVRMQPKRTRKDGKESVQKHARNNYSVMLVLQKPKKTTPTVAARKNQIRKRKMIHAYKTAEGCADCGFNANPLALDFDHVRGDKVLNIGKRLATVGITQILDEIEKCDVVCSNCHRERTALRSRGVR